uniref:protein DEHYDRATION-INDUCED 19 homolog 4-like n=1 Tax=Erigeron canadensis TaxID=72917 RepID=UPI001CB96A52|nr:protein DEHYDRATION-INDUCED 19 homolog 4-like [Erigeron canadensis]
MDSDSWTRISTSNSSSSSSLRRYQSRSEAFHHVEEFESDDEPRPEYLCPFCAEDFDIVGLCCHIEEEHPVEAKNGICPVCAKKVGTDLISHITVQHGSLLKIQRKRRLRKGGANSTLSILKKEFREGNLQSLLGGSAYLVQPTNSTEPEPWLSSFISNTPAVHEPPSAQPSEAAESESIVEGTNKDLSQRSNEQQAPLSEKDQEEKARRSEFVQGLLFSTFLDDGL